MSAIGSRSHGAHPLRLALLSVVLVVVSVLAGAMAAVPGGDAASSDDAAIRPPAAAAQASATDARPGAAGDGHAIEVARVRGVSLVAVSRAALVVGLHESANPRALPLEVTGPVAADHAGAGLEVGRRDAGAGSLQVMVLPSRRRAAGPTSAMDVVLAQDQPVASPVDGTVLVVEDYALYGAEPDTRIALVPDGAPGLVVVMLHVRDPKVSPGDAVRAGETVLAGAARVLDVGSQIDRYTRRSVQQEAPPHVHIEVHER